MRTCTKILMAVLLISANSLLVSADETELLEALERLSSGELFFDVLVEQNGRIVPVRENLAELDRRPFTLILLLREPVGILVNFRTRTIGNN